MTNAPSSAQFLRVMREQGGSAGNGKVRDVVGMADAFGAWQHAGLKKLEGQLQRVDDARAIQPLRPPDKLHIVAIDEIRPVRRAAGAEGALRNFLARRDAAGGASEHSGRGRQAVILARGGLIGLAAPLPSCLSRPRDTATYSSERAPRNCQAPRRMAQL